MNEVDVVFSAVGTPPDEDGSADLSYVLEVARTIGRNMQKYILVVTKSTVPVGTAKKVRAAIQEELDKRGVSIQFDVASNPEFLKEGNAINDFMSPDRVVVGVESERAKKLMSKLYKPFLLNNFRVIFMEYTHLISILLGSFDECFYIFRKARTTITNTRVKELTPDSGI